MMLGNLPGFAHPIVRKFLGFALVGLVGTSTHYAVLTALVEIGHVPVLISTSAGFAAGAMVNYLLSRRLIFVSEAAHMVALPKFLVVAALGSICNLLVVAWLVGNLGVHYLLAQLCATGTVLFWNFAANHLWTFRQ